MKVRYYINKSDNLPLILLRQIRETDGSTGFFRVPCNVRLAKEKITGDSVRIKNDYFTNCKRFGLLPLEFKKDNNMNLNQIFNILSQVELGLRDEVAIRKNTIDVFKKIEKDLSMEKNLYLKFKDLFHPSDAYITSSYDYAVLYAKKKNEGLNPEKLSEFLKKKVIKRGLKGINEYPFHQRKNPKLVFYMLNEIRFLEPETFENIMKKLKTRNENIYFRIEDIIEGYKRSEDWFLSAISFFYKEKWFKPKRKEDFYSLKDLIERFWKVYLDEVPQEKVKIIYLGYPDARGFCKTDLQWLEKAFVGVNKGGINYLKKLPTEGKLKLLTEIDHTKSKFVEKNNSYTLVSPKEFIPDPIRTTSELLFDIGIPILDAVVTLIHELTHSIFNEIRESYSIQMVNGKETIDFRLDDYVNEGLAEFIQQILMKNIFIRFPYLNSFWHSRLYVFSKLRPYDSHFQGYLWFKTVYELLDKDPYKVLKLALKNYQDIEGILSDPIVIEKAKSFSSDTILEILWRSPQKEPKSTISPMMKFVLEDE